LFTICEKGGARRRFDGGVAEFAGAICGMQGGKSNYSGKATEDEPSEVEEPSLDEKEQARGNNSYTSDNCNGFDSSCVDAGCESVNCLSAVDCGTCDLAGLEGRATTLSIVK
jgi:hypothetical protein